LSLRGWRRIAVIASMPFILNGLILGGSRGAFLAVTVGGLVLMLLKPAQHKRVFWVFAIVGVGLAVSLMDKRFIDRMMTIETAVEDVADADLSAQSRVELQKAQFQMFARYPFGSGHKGTALLASQFLDEKWMAHDEYGRNTGMRSSHNTFLTTLVEQGIVGATLYLSMVGWWLLSVFRLWRLRRLGMNSDLVSQGAALAGAIAVVLFAGNFTDYLMAEIQFWLFAMLAALLASSPELRTVSKATPPSRTVGETQLRGQP
jgi:O-antigen ligase